MKPNGLKSAGFTLIEVMVVVIIVAALASIVAPYLMDIPDRAKGKIARASIENIGVALKLYRLDTGSYPKDLDELRRVPVGVKSRNAPYLDREALDPWESKFVYKCPGSKNVTTYDLYSIGANKTDESGGGDDIGNWQ